MLCELLLVAEWRCRLHDAGMGVTRWTKALADLQGLGCSLNRPNLEALFRSAVHAPVSCKHLLPLMQICCHVAANPAKLFND